MCVYVCVCILYVCICIACDDTVCSAAAAIKNTHEWTVWRGGHLSSHRHFNTNTTSVRTATSGRGVVDEAIGWRAPNAVGRVSEDRQRRNVGIGPLWTGNGAQESEGPPLVIVNAFPLLFRGPFDHTDAAASNSRDPTECICHTAEPRGNIERSRRPRSQRSLDKGGGSKGVLVAELGHSGIQRGHSAGSPRVRATPTADMLPNSSSQRVEQLRESHLAMLGAAKQAAESGDRQLRQRATTALEYRVQQIDSAISALAAARAKARVESYTHWQGSGV